MTLKQHEQISLELYGESGTDVHKFLDQYYSKYEDQHRIIYHHICGLIEIKKEFKSEICIKIASQHIIDDIGILPSNFNFYGTLFFLKPNLYLDIEHELLRIYGNNLELKEYLDAYL